VPVAAIVIGALAGTGGALWHLDRDASVGPVTSAAEDAASGTPAALDVLLGTPVADIRDGGRGAWFAFLDRRGVDPPDWMTRCP
jgi:hypothetical protein